MLLGLPWTGASAEPLVDPGDRQVLQAATEVTKAADDLAESPVDVQGWIQREAAGSLLAGVFDADRQAVLRQGWNGRAPTWIQDTSAVNLGDFPTLDNTVERAERDLKTLEWLLEEQRRLASGKPAREPGGAATAPEDNWLRRMIPTHWVATLKANREWVAAGGTALLVIVWGTTMFARRPTSIPVEAPPVPRSPQRRRRHRGAHHVAG